MGSATEASGQATAADVRKVPVYCYQCVAGPDLLKVEVRDGVPVRVEPNLDVAAEHPGRGRVCVRAYALIQKMHNPNRVQQPLRRTNPRKGRHEDPGFVPITWDEALDLVAAKLRAIRAQGLLNEQGLPRLAATLGSGGIAPAYFGTFGAFLAAWGRVDFSIGSGQGIKCTHSEHVYGEFWHRGFTVAPDTPHCRYVISFGTNTDASGGVAGVWRHGEARDRGIRWMQFEPHLSITGAAADRWIPVKPKTDAAVLFALIHILLHEMQWREACDVAFLRDRTSSPYLVGPRGYYLRDPESRKPLLWDAADGRAKPYDDPTLRDPALEGEHRVRGIEVGPDGQTWDGEAVDCNPAFQRLRDHVKCYTPEWAAGVADVPAEVLRQVAREYVEAAQVGATITVDGVELPLRPVAVLLGKTVNNGWGGYECCWGRTVLSALVGALEVPGGTLGTTVRLNRPGTDRLKSVRPGTDGFMDQPLNPTDRARWEAAPTSRSAYKTLVPLIGDSPWSPALGPAHLPWLFLEDRPADWPEPSLPDVWITYRTNPAISHWDSARVEKALARFPFIVSFAYTLDETNWYADVVLPESTDLESLQLYRAGGTKYIEQFWEHTGWVLRQPAGEPAYDTRDITDVAGELAARTGLLPRYLEALNRGAGIGVPLRGEGYDFRLDVAAAAPPNAAETWDRACRAASFSLTDGREVYDLDWFKAHGALFVPVPRTQWYLHPVMVAQGLRYELPYQERIRRVGEELAHRLHEKGIRWWDEQLAEYQTLPAWKDFPDIWGRAAALFGKRPEDYPLWLLTSRSMQYSWGSNVAVPILAEMAANIRGHEGVVLNAATAARLGIAEGDPIWVESPIGRVRGVATLREGIRPDTALALQQFGHWVTPVAKELGRRLPNLNALAPLHLSLTDATGSGADLVRVKVYRATENDQ
jgi:phenylacetyl-CoA:acceptor oxidoreductase